MRHVQLHVSNEVLFFHFPSKQTSQETGNNTRTDTIEGKLLFGFVDNANDILVSLAFN